MSSRIRSLLAAVPVALLALLLAAGAATAGEGATKTAFTGSETFVGPVSAGTEFFPDGRYHVRGAQQRFAFAADDPRLNNADNLVTINWNFRLVDPPIFVSGQMWGEFTLTNENGYWKGTWTGVRDERGFSYFHFVGAGGAGYEGLQLRMWGSRESPDPSLPELYEGIIIEPGKKY